MANNRSNVYDASVYIDVDNNGEITRIEKRFNTLTKIKAQDFVYCYREYIMINMTYTNNRINGFIEFVLRFIDKNQNIYNCDNRGKILKIGVEVKNRRKIYNKAGFYIIFKNEPHVNEIIENAYDVKSKSFTIYNNIPNFDFKKLDLVSHRPQIFFKPPYKEEDVKYFYITENNRYILPLYRLKDKTAVLIKTGKNEFRFTTVCNTYMYNIMYSTNKQRTFDNNGNDAYSIFDSFINKSHNKNGYYKFYVKYKTCDNKNRRFYINDKITDICNNNVYIINNFHVDIVDEKVNVSLKDVNGLISNISLKNLITEAIVSRDLLGVEYRFVQSDDCIVVPKNIKEEIKKLESYMGNIDEFRVKYNELEKFI